MEVVTVIREDKIIQSAEVAFPWIAAETPNAPTFCTETAKEEIFKKKKKKYI